jgi:hypothetical protein
MYYIMCMYIVNVGTSVLIHMNQKCSKEREKFASKSAKLQRASRLTGKVCPPTQRQGLSNIPLRSFEQTVEVFRTSHDKETLGFEKQCQICARKLCCNPSLNRLSIFSRQR